MSSTSRFVFFAAMAMLSFSAYAAHQGVVHYEGKIPTSVKNAFELIAQRTQLAEEALKKNELESVHEQSYTLETSGDFLQAQVKKQQAALDGLNEAVQEVHALSEKGDAAGVRKALPRLKKYSQELQALMECK